MIINQRVYVTNDGRYVGEGDPAAAFLAYSAGTEVADREVVRLGLEPWATSGQVVRAPSVIISTDASGQRTMASAGSSRVVPVGTVPPGHATASDPAVPVETAEPVANADGTFRGQVVPPTTARQQQPARAGAVKPSARITREV